ncbi:GyrI-like domain-containing protein [Bailinhaonella thermotolerans]|uniref:AraC family transcriptional regulator n=1 Tax=Bailinhaonella thermotolerans TaxID=1070861 RepID=A0A3A4AUV4_9ACTN|nr:GyrI-like domain-containing protein [Bailinhaonella thermotolerans]RJL33375.1 AraC family transcriptional regulator [Bailinhaonella thermotolerans]
MEPRVEHLGEQPSAGITRHVTLTTMGLLNERVPVLYGWLGERGIAPAGPLFYRYHEIADDGTMRVEAGVPVPAPVEGDGEVAPGVLPAGPYATAGHRGHPDTLFETEAALLSWTPPPGLAWSMTRANGTEHWTARLERFLTNPEDQPDPGEWEMEFAVLLTRS